MAFSIAAYIFATGRGGTVFGALKPGDRFRFANHANPTHTFRTGRTVPNPVYTKGPAGGWYHDATGRRSRTGVNALVFPVTDR